MSDLEIVTAALRWHTLHERRMVIGGEQRKFQQTRKQLTGFGGSDSSIGQRLTAAKRLELAAMRSLAKHCARARGQQIDDADVIDIDMPVILIG